ncbi:hypothetical protein MHD_03190 [Mannheimia granulomatis]|uniref:Uncharacterized protein n=1 Tax=Mannheimia granulomatis TaxID=85402 RepID=A0A011NFY4_9PAST|nr:hypothetical protein [Mannheimia granulomatis]EXI63295.1 hypothetical protein AK33_01765 [Mannheimia granulomatis]RGE48972.1 hypothetical protein MHD_03190 [Mannheimia granulomatis]
MAKHYSVTKEEFRNLHSNLPKSMFGVVESITFFVAPKNSTFIDNGVRSTSSFGHVFIGATKFDPVLILIRQCH